MRYRNTIIMVVVLAVLIVVAFLLLSPQPTSAPGTGQVWSFANETVTDINMSQDNGKRTEVLLKDGNWNVISGTQILPADQSQVQSAANLLLQLQGEEVTRKSGSALKDYGLDPPRAVITVTFQSGKNATLLVGDNVPTNNLQHYVADKAKSDKVFTNADNTVSTLTGWFNAPPLLQPTPTPLPLAPTNTPAPSVITGTTTLTKTGTLTTTSTRTVTNTTTITSTGTVTK
jgi:Domain of unknown function (DUF4340)